MVPALGMQTYYVRQNKPEEGKNEELSVATVKIFNSKAQLFQVDPFSTVDVQSNGAEFSLSNTYITAEFDKDGLLQGVTTKDDGMKTKTKVEFVEYGTKTRGDKSGAYLFLPGNYIPHILIMLYISDDCRWPGESKEDGEAPGEGGGGQAQVHRDGGAEVGEAYRGAEHLSWGGWCWCADRE